MGTSTNQKATLRQHTFQTSGGLSKSTPSPPTTGGVAAIIDIKLQTNNCYQINTILSAIFTEKEKKMV